MNRQSIITILLTIFMSMTGAKAFAHDIEAVNNDGVTIYYIWANDAKTELAVSYRGSSYSSYDEYYDDVVIPKSVDYNGNTYPVTAIGEHAFSSCYFLASVTIPNSVTSIGDDAFSVCGDLTSITIPNSVTSIGNNAFVMCYNLASVTIGNSVTSIGDRAFSNCSLLASVTIPNSVTSIGDEAFWNCSGLTSVTIPNSVTSIGDDAFGACYSLTSVTIGNSVTSIGNYAFSRCSSLASVTVNCSPTTIGESPFSKCTKIEEISFGCETVTSIFSGFSSIKKITLSENVKTIGQSAFYNCSGLTSVTIPNSVTSIDDGAFENCYGLTSVTIGNSVTSIGNNAFKKCSSLASVTINCSPATIGSSPFYSCTKIKEVSFDCETVTSIFSGFSSIKKITLSENVKTIGQSAFRNCSGLTSVTIPNSVTSIGNYAFSGCSGLTSVTIPNSVTSIGNYAFSGCSGLTSVTIPNSVKSIGEEAFCGCNGLTSVTIPNSVTSIGISAFSGCSGLTSVIIPNSVTSIGNYTFSGCSGLTSVTIPNSVISIGDGAFENCYGLTSVTIPNSVKSIGEEAFCGCNGLTSVTFGNSVTSIGNYAFSRCSGLTSVTIGNSVTSIGNYAFSGCSGLTSVIIGSGVLSIGTSAFYDNKLKKVIWLTNTPPSGYNYAKGTVNYVSNDQFNISNKVVYKFLSSNFVVDGIRYVPVSPSDRTCDAIDCTYDASLENINIGETVTNKEVTLTVKKVNPYTCYGNKYVKNLKLSLSGEIGDYAFYGCDNLESVELGQNIPSIGSYAFKRCFKLKSIVIPDAVTSLGPYAFQNCSAMTSAKTGNGIETINEYTFSGCSSLTEMNIGSKVKTINQYAFSGCSSLPAITIPQTVTTIGNHVFSNCTSLTKVTIADSETTLALGSNEGRPIFSSCPLDYVYIGRDISYKTSSGYGYSPFYRNTSLNAVKIADKETEISENEFYGCTNLQQVEIGDGVTSIGNWAFSGCSSLKYFAFGTQVKTIGKEAFSDCTAVTKIISKANTPPACGSQALDDINKWECKLSVPQGRKAIYQAAEQWKEFFYIEEGTDDPVIPDTPKTDKDGVTYVADGDLAVVSTGLSAKGEVKICDMVEINGKSYQVTTIAEGAFKDNSEITFVDIPNTVESIGMSAFEGCTNLGIIHIGEGVKQIASRAFANVYSNRTRTRSGEKKLEVYCYAEDVPNTAEDVFDGSPTESSILHVPAKAFKAYKDMSPWNKFKEIVALNNSTALTDKGILFSMKDDGTLEVTGLEEETKTVDILSSVTINDIEYQVTSIGKRAFEGRDDIEYLSIPWSVKSIGEFAFIDCGNNITVNIADPESWCQMELGNEHSSPLACAKKVLVFDIETDNIIIPEGVTFIGNYTFYQCRCIKSLTIPSTVTFIGSSAFEGCTGLTSLTLNEGLESVGGSAFEGCSGLQTLTIPSTVNTISINAFAGCKGITDVYCLAEDVPNTDENAFNGTPTEKSTLHVPANVVEAYRAAWPWSDFKEIVALTDVGIMKVRSDDDNGEYFDLYGRKVYQPQKGLNIFRRHDGKIVKILVK